MNQGELGGEWEKGLEMTMTAKGAFSSATVCKSGPRTKTRAREEVSVMRGASRAVDEMDFVLGRGLGRDMKKQKIIVVLTRIHIKVGTIT